MKIRITCEDYKKLIHSIIEKVNSKELTNWILVDAFNSKGIKVRRLCHDVSANQYKIVQLAFVAPSKDDTAVSVMYLDMIPKMSNPRCKKDEFESKAKIVLGRWCEMLNTHFPEIKEYKVYL